MLPLIALLILAPTPAAAQRNAPAVLVDDFEGGTGKWQTNDALAPEQGRPTLAAIYAVAADAPGGGAQGALVEFTEGRDAWASVTTSVSGATWADNKCSGIALWLRGDGEKRHVGIVLRAYTQEGDETVDTQFGKSISTSNDEWYAVRIPFAAFRDKDANPLSTAKLRDVKLLQFVQTGSWQATRFTIDEIRAEVFPAVAPPVTAAGATLIDFDDDGQVSRLAHGVCLGGSHAKLLADERFSAKVVASLALLGRATVRVQLSNFYAPDGAAVRTSELQQVIGWIRQCGCEPLLCLDSPLPRAGVSPAQGWRDFGALCAEIAKQREAEPGVHYYEVGREPLLAGQFATIEAATDAYNALAAQVRHADPLARVGGMGFASPWDANLEHFVTNARALDFLTFHFYAAHSPIATNDDLFKAACRGKSGDLPHQASLGEIRELVTARDPGLEVWITECALNSGRDAAGRARDARIETHFAGAWLTAFSVSAAPYVDRVLWFKAYGDGWGMLTDGGDATPALHAAALVTRFMPTGSSVGKPILAGPAGLLAPITTPTGRSVVVANAADAAGYDVVVTGSPDVQPIRLHRSDPTTDGPDSEPCVPSTRQKLTLRGPGLAIIEAPNGP